MVKSMQCSLGVVIGVGLLMSGCASMNVTKDLPFPEGQDHIQQRVSLHATPETEAFMVEGSFMGGPPMGRTYKIPVGEALVPNAQRCLASVFEGVDVVTNQPQANTSLYTVDLDFPEKGQIDIGLTSFSASAVTLSLRARVRGRDGTVMLETTSKTKASAKSRWQIAAIIPIFGALGHDKAIVLAAEKSLQQSLDEIRSFLLKNKGSFTKDKLN